jgi:hypothetical protein
MRASWLSSPQRAYGKSQPFLDRIFPLSQIAEAHRYLDSYDCVGETVVLPGPVARGDEATEKAEEKWGMEQFILRYPE